jgi:hypothetical protein
MTALTAPPIDPAIAAKLSDGELEEELTLASLTTAREATFEVLLAERRRRRTGCAETNDRTSIWRRLADSFASRDGVLD